MNRNTDNQRSFSIDTTFVLFFLAVEIGQSTQLFAFDTLLMSVTMAMVLVLPYWLTSDAEPPAFSKWLARRGVVACAGFLGGLLFAQSVGTLIPGSLKFIPMTLLIITAMISCYVQIYGLMRLRLAK